MKTFYYLIQSLNQSINPKSFVMKTHSLIAILLAVFTLTFTIRCTESKTKPSNEVKSAVVIVQDVSGSIRSDQDSVQKKAIHHYLKANFQAGNDIILLHASSFSNSAINHNVIGYKSNTVQNDGFQTETDKMMQEANEKMAHKRMAKQMEAQLFEQMFGQKPESSSETKLVEIIPALDKLRQNYSGGLKVLLISDMQECSSTIRNFEKNPLQSKQQAEKFADEDAEKLRKMYTISADALQSVQGIQVLVPSQTDQKKLIFTPFYFDRLFSNFGYSKTKWDSL